MPVPRSSSLSEGVGYRRESRGEEEITPEILIGVIDRRRRLRAMRVTGLGKCGDVSFHSITVTQPSLPHSRASWAAVLQYSRSKCDTRHATRHDTTRHATILALGIDCSIFLSRAFLFLPRYRGWSFICRHSGWLRRKSDRYGLGPDIAINYIL